jgi:SsrA-binding protein
MKNINMVISKNKEVYFQYEVLETFTAGIMLSGSEVKSIRGRKVSIKEGYCFIKDDEIFVKNMHISEYDKIGKYNNHDPIRDKKLLLNKRDILKLKECITQKGLTIVPISVLLTNIGFIKLEIGLCKGKKTYDKKNTIKLRDLDRELKKTQLKI